MARDHEDILSWDNGHLTRQSIESYNSSRLSDLDMHKAERHLLNCNLCSDALEGYAKVPGSAKVKKNLEALRNELRQGEKRQEKSITWWKPLGIAASIAVLLGIGFYLFRETGFKLKQKPEVALLKEEPESPPTQSRRAPVSAAQLNDLEDGSLLTEEENLPEETEDILDIEEADPSPPPAETGISSQRKDEDPAVELETEDPLTDVATINRDDGTLAIKRNEQQAPEEGISAPGDAEEGGQADIPPLSQERLVQAKKTAIEDNGSVAEGGPELSSSSALASGAKLGGSIMDSDPEPEIGFQQYANYLRENLEYPEEARLNNISGVVKISFTLKPGSDYSKFKVIEGLGFGCDEEAERLIKAGPNWKPAIRQGIATKEDVIVEVRFEP